MFMKLNLNPNRQAMKPHSHHFSILNSFYARDWIARYMGFRCLISMYNSCDQVLYTFSTKTGWSFSHCIQHKVFQLLSPVRLILYRYYWWHVVCMFVSWLRHMSVIIMMILVDAIYSSHGWMAQRFEVWSVLISVPFIFICSSCSKTDQSSSDKSRRRSKEKKSSREDKKDKNRDKDRKSSTSRDRRASRDRKLSPNRDGRFNIRRFV